VHLFNPMEKTFLEVLNVEVQVPQMSTLLNSSVLASYILAGRLGALTNNIQRPVTVTSRNNMPSILTSGVAACVPTCQIGMTP
jgi:hypothetical protein